MFGTVGVAPDIEFVATELDPLANIRSPVGSNTYLNHGSLSLLFEDLLGDVRFRSPWRDLDKSIAHVDQRGARLPQRARRAARGLEGRGDPPGVLPDLARLPGRAHRRAGVRDAAGDRAQEHRRRRAGGRGDAGGGRRQHCVQLHPLLLPRRPGARRRGGRVPQVDHAAQAGERAVHRAGAGQAGQDRALPRADAPPRHAPATSSCTPPASAAW